MIEKANSLGALGITKDTRGPNKPATNVSWFEGARFVNWLNTSTGHPPAYKFDASGNFQLWQPLDPGYDANNLFRNQRAMYFLPSADEWYKAAYYDPIVTAYYQFPTASNVTPVSVTNGTTAGSAVFQQLGPADNSQAGGLSPLGTMAQGGNVAEWNEMELNAPTHYPNLFSRGFRGGDWGSLSSDLMSSSGFNVGGSSEFFTVGLRVASVVPEPNATAVIVTYSVIVTGLRIRLSHRRRRHNAKFTV